jgi:hypothetical protein
MGNLTLIFGETDYIYPSDFASPAVEKADKLVLPTGHFSMLDEAEKLTRVVERVTM